MSENLPNPHDAFFRQSFSRLETARNFLRRFLPPDVCRRLDLDTLELTTESFIDAELRSSYSDMLFTVALSGTDRSEADAVSAESRAEAQTGCVYVLCEHKSTADRMTAFQLLRYMVRIWEKQYREERKLQPIVPVVVYHGLQEWKVPKSMADIIDGPEEFVAYAPQFVSHLIDLGQCDDDELPTENVTLATLLLLKYIARSALADRLITIMSLLNELLEQPDGLENFRAFLIYLHVGTNQIDDQQLLQILKQTYSERGEELMGTIAEKLTADARREALQEGHQEGLRAGVRAIVELRFPADSERVMRRVDTVDSGDLLLELLSLTSSVQSADELLARIDQQA